MKIPRWLAISFICLISFGAFFLVPAAVGAQSSGEKPAWEDVECYFNKKQIQMGPRALLESFLASNSRGVFIGNDNLDSLILCPGHQGGPDFFEVIKGYKISKEKIEKDEAEFSVVFDLLGRLTSGGDKGELNSFIKEVRPEEVVFKLRKTPYGWRINFESTYGNKVLVAHAAKFISKRKWVDGQESLFRSTISNK